jgi:hypothetical protein
MWTLVYVDKDGRRKQSPEVLCDTIRAVVTAQWQMERGAVEIVLTKTPNSADPRPTPRTRA